MKISFTGQSKSEIQKNFKRVRDIINKSGGNVDMISSLSRSQANRITDEYKAINRAMAAKEMGYDDVFEIFFRRAYELGSVGQQEYRDYQLTKLGLK